jgi:thiol-disulfide isomerase/thioredoxin
VRIFIFSALVLAGCAATKSAQPPPVEVESDRERYDAALQLVAEQLTTPESKEADEARRMLDELARDAKDEDVRFDAALVALKFAHRPERERRVAEMLSVFAHRRDLDQVYYWLVAVQLEDGDVVAAGRTSQLLLDQYRETIQNEKYHLDVVRRAALIGARLPVALEPAMERALRGKIVLVDFGATWCAPCIAELPRLKKFYATNAGKGFEILGVSLDEQRTIMERFVDEEDILWPMLHSPRSPEALSEVCGISDLPTYLVIDREGFIRATELRGERLYTHLLGLLDHRD